MIDDKGQRIIPTYMSAKAILPAIEAMGPKRNKLKECL